MLIVSNTVLFILPSKLEERDDVCIERKDTLPLTAMFSIIGWFLSPQHKYVEVLSHSMSECGLYWKSVYWRYC